MNEKNMKLCRYTVGIVFLLVAIQQVTLWVAGQNVVVMDIAFLIGSLLIGVSMLADIPMLLTVGSVLSAFSYLGDFGRIADMNNKGLWICCALLLIAGYVLFAVAGVQKNSAIKFCVAATIVAVVGGIFGTFYKYLGRADFSLMPYYLINNVRDDIVRLGLPVILAGVVLENTAANPASMMLGGKKATAASSNRIEYLTKLKELLDAGTITQEEFDAKKKQLLGL